MVFRANLNSITLSLELGNVMSAPLMRNMCLQILMYLFILLLTIKLGRSITIGLVLIVISVVLLIILQKVYTQIKYIQQDIVNDLWILRENDILSNS